MKKLLSFTMALLFACSMGGCKNADAPTPAYSAASFTDGLGYTVHVNSPEKVAVVSGSFAQTWQLAGGKLAAVTEDAYSEGRMQEDAAIANLGAVKSPDVERMIALGIDFVILSANISEHVALRDQLENAGMTTAYFDVETFEEYLAMLKICTTITGRTDLYEQNGAAVRERVDAAIAKKQGQDAPSVLFIRAFSTGAKAKNSDSMTGAMLKDLGCVNIADADDSLLEDLSIERIILDDPDYIFVTAMGASSKAALQALAEGIQRNPAWAELSAVKLGRYIVLPRELFHYKPNARWGESYEMLADILYGK